MARDLTPRQAAAQIRGLLHVGFAAVVKEMPVAITEAEAALKQHVFLKGQSAEQGAIGSYSSKPGYFSIKGLREKYGSQIPISKLKPRGKPRYGRKKGFTQRRRNDELVDLESVYFPDGYTGLRNALGRQTGFVDLKLSGALERSIKSGFRANEAQIAFTNEDRQKVARGHEEHYGKVIWALNDDMRANLYDRLGDAAALAINEFRQ